MRMRWRFGLVAIIAAAVVAGFTPHGVLSAAESSGAEMVSLAEAPVAMPLMCMDVTCGKGTPAMSAPTPAVALGRGHGRDRGRDRGGLRHPAPPGAGRRPARGRTRPALPPAPVLLARNCAPGASAGSRCAGTGAPGHHAGRPSRAPASSPRARALRRLGRISGERSVEVSNRVVAHRRGPPRRSNPRSARRAPAHRAPPPRSRPQVVTPPRRQQRSGRRRGATAAGRRRGRAGPPVGGRPHGPRSVRGTPC